MTRLIILSVTMFTLAVTLRIRVVAPAQNIKPWAPFLSTPYPYSAIHDLTAFTDPSDGVRKLVIAMGYEPAAPVLFWNPVTQQITTAFQAPLNTYTGEPYWRSVLPFKGKLYAGLGNNTPSPSPGQPNTGQVWQYDRSKWTVVLSTQLNDIYTLGVYNSRLYAGAGSYGSQGGQLWVTANGTNWKMLKQFSADWVRSLVVFQNKLYIGLRIRADVWTFDGTKFVEIGPPPTMTGTRSQIKTMVVSPDNSLLYLGGIPSYIYTWDGSTYTLSLDATATDTGIFKGATYKGAMFFPTHSRQNGGQAGNIYRLSHGTWKLDYSTPIGLALINVVLPFQGYIYAGGAGTPPELLQALYQ